MFSLNTDYVFEQISRMINISSINVISLKSCIPPKDRVIWQNCETLKEISHNATFSSRSILFAKTTLAKEKENN